MAFVLLVFWWPVRAKHTPFKWRWSIVLIGALLAVADIMYFKALGYQGAMISLVAAVRSGSVVISFLGGAFIFGEVQIRHKAVALVGVIAGVLMLLLSH
jgi:transporter family protein